MVSRREFLTNDLLNLLKDTYRAFNEETAGEEEKEENNIKEYFRSFETCYPFLAEVSLEELQYDARKMDIDPAGKDKYELARLIFNCNDKCDSKK